MAGITLADAQAKLTLWLDAETAVASGQSYRIGNRAFNRTDADTITKKIDYWDAKVKQLSRGAGGGARVRYGVKTEG